MQRPKMPRKLSTVPASTGPSGGKGETQGDVLELLPCHQCGEPAVEQVRGQMGPGDYKEVTKINHKGREIFDVDFYKTVHLDEYNRNDFRISCSDCDNATPWLQKDLQGLPDTGAEYTRKLWNKINSAPYPHRKIT